MAVYLFGQQKEWKNHITLQEQHISDTQDMGEEKQEPTVYWRSFNGSTDINFYNTTHNKKISNIKSLIHTKRYKKLFKKGNRLIRVPQPKLTLIVGWLQKEDRADTGSQVEASLTPDIDLLAPSSLSAISTFPQKRRYSCFL